MNPENFPPNVAEITSAIAVGLSDEPSAKDALIVVDVQNDFLPGGALAVPRGDEVVPVLNGYITAFAEKSLPIFATRDWHPVNHCSFKEQGGPWPAHCVVGSRGAEAPPALRLPASAVIIFKPSAPDRETYSGFDGTELEKELRNAGVRRLFVGGLATDYCVLNTVKDALQRGFEAMLLVEAIRAVNVRPDDGANAEAEMVRLGAIPFSREGVAA